MKKSIQVILAFSIFSFSTCAPKKDPNACNRDLVQSYSMDGVDKFQYTMLEMCPEVRKSCCSKEDQMQMFTNWVHAGEESKVRHRYERAEQNYTALLERLVDVQEFAEKIVERLSAKKVANCKILAERVINFDIKTVAPIIENNMNKTTEFWVESYQGFYCSICDFENHKFFNVTKNKIVFDDQFCRDIVEHNLPNLMYFHSHFVKYLNLVNKFMTSCDYKGEFNLDAIIPSNLTFTIDEETKKDLYECRDFRNTKDWFVYCKDICENFNLVQFDDFFEPHREKYVNYIHFIDQQLETIRYAEEKNPLVANSPISGPPTTGSKHKNVKKALKLRLLSGHQTAVKKDDPTVFKPAMGARIQLGSMETEFAEEGINLYQVGKTATIVEGIFNQMKTLANLKKLRDSGQTLSPAQKGMLGNSKK